ncbi:MAG: hypothetical protein GX432_04750 [Candidatus Atribacteria bacterium]|nr:hypothetical protein [Candidatus Atribacteria bacterium]
MKARDEILVGCSKKMTLKNGSGIFRINPHATLVAPDDKENTYLKSSLRGDQPFFGWTTW